MSAFSTWKEAHTAALEQARRLNKDVGIYRQREFNREVYRVFLLPKPEHRSGRELMCEVVRPDDPITEVRGAH